MSDATISADLRAAPEQVRRAALSGEESEPRRQRRRPRPSLIVAGAMTTAWAVVVSLSPVLALVLLGWLTGGHSSFPVATAIRFGIAVWLGAHGVPISTDAGQVTLMPLLLTVWIAWRLYRAGQFAARASRADSSPSTVGQIAGVVASVYMLLVVAAIWFLHSAPAPVSLSMWVALLITGGFALTGAALGAAVETGRARDYWRALPRWISAGLRAGAWVLVVTFGVAAALVGARLALAAPDAAAMIRSYEGGAAAALGLFVLSMLYAPTMLGWAVAYLLGPGFAIGVNTKVSAIDVALGPVPAVPILAVVPSQAAPAVGAAALVLLFGVAVAAGCWLVVRAGLGSGRLALFAAGLSGPVAGAVFGLLAWLSSGSLGSGDLANVGPVWWQVALAGTALVSLGAVLGAAATLAVIRLRRP